jgi:hypothetical protein
MWAAGMIVHDWCMTGNILQNKATTAIFFNLFWHNVCLVRCAENNLSVISVLFIGFAIADVCYQQ